MKIIETLLNKIYYPSKFIIKYYFKLIKDSDKINYRKNRFLTFGDDFNSHSLNLKKWNHTISWYQPIENSYHYTQGENLQFTGKSVKFIAKYEPQTISGWWGNKKVYFTSGEINSKDKFSQRYGRFEAKIKLVDKKGFFPSFWLLTDTYTHCDSPATNKEVITPEIDIFELFGQKQRNKIQMTLHTGLSYQKPWLFSLATSIRFIKWHDKTFVFSVEVTNEKIKYYINDELIKVISQKYLKENQRVHRPLYFIVTNSINSKYMLSEYNKNPNYINECGDGIELFWVRCYK